MTGPEDPKKPPQFFTKEGEKHFKLLGEILKEKPQLVEAITYYIELERRHCIIALDEANVDDARDLGLVAKGGRDFLKNLMGTVMQLPVKYDQYQKAAVAAGE